MSHYSNLSTTEEDPGMPMSPTRIPASASQEWLDEHDFIDLYRHDSAARVTHENRTVAPRKYTPNVASKRSKRRKYILFGIPLVIIIALAVAIPVALKSKHSSNKGSTSTSSSSSSGSSNGATSGSDGSLITMDNGTTFTYRNSFGGDWVYDPKNPFTGGGKAQSWSKRIASEEWDWGTDTARGVNLGGWLVTEPFIAPSLYEKYINNSLGIVVVDEWTLCLAMADNITTELETHYSTFITEQDFADIAAAGLNWVRIPIGFWAIETIEQEPFLVGTCWSYFLKAIQWARKYGIRIYLDLHALPGSQNGWNHSGKQGSVNFMYGVMGVANAQRTLTYLRILTEFVSQPQYSDVVGIIGIVNEILWGTIGEIPVQSFYLAAYEAIRTSTGIGAGLGPYIAIHEGFQGPAMWAGFMAGADRLALDQHPYLAFMGDHSDPSVIAQKPCTWAIATNQSQGAFGLTIGGEFSVAINDCGLWLNGIGAEATDYDCATWDNWTAYNSSTKDALTQVALASMDALSNFFFWTWKIGESTVLGTSSSPMWHYQLGLQQGWIPADPREAIGHCASVLGSSQIFSGTYAAYATGGAGAGTITAQTTSFTFPPTTIGPSFTGSQIGLLPTYTPTGTLKSLFAPTFTAAPSLAVGTGWNNSADTQLAYVEVAGCTYPNNWDAVNATLPTATCKGS